MSSRGFAVETAMDGQQMDTDQHAFEGNMDRKTPGQVADLNEQRTMNRKPLRETIDQALKAYFDDLNGTEPGDLYAMVLQEVEQPLLKRVLEYTRGNQSRAAELLGINRSTLRKKLRQHDLID